MYSFKPLLVMGLLALASTANPLGPRSPDGKPHFGRHWQIGVARYTGPHCDEGKYKNENTLIDKKWIRVSTTEKCHTFDRPFNSFDFSWAHYNTWLEEAKDYGNCQILMYQGRDCQGGDAGFYDHVNTIIKDRSVFCTGPFYSDEDNADGSPKLTSAQSMRVRCERGGIQDGTMIPEP